MKRYIAFLLAAMMLLSLAACGTKRESAESVAEKAIQAAQKLDAEQMQKYSVIGLVCKDIEKNYQRTCI